MVALQTGGDLFPFVLVAPLMGCLLLRVPSHQSCIFQLMGPRNCGLVAPNLQDRHLLLFI